MCQLKMKTRIYSAPAVKVLNWSTSREAMTMFCDLVVDTAAYMSSCAYIILTIV